MGSHCVGRVNRLKASGVETPSEGLPTLLRRYRYANTTTHWLTDEI
ncbi:hypothetical protein [Nostoc sp.]